MPAITVDLTDLTRTMDPTRVTEREGFWYLRQVWGDDYHVGLCSNRAPAGTAARDLKPSTLEVVCDHEDGVALDAAGLAAFLAWPPEAVQS